MDNIETFKKQFLELIEQVEKTDLTHDEKFQLYGDVRSVLIDKMLFAIKNRNTQRILDRVNEEQMQIKTDYVVADKSITEENVEVSETAKNEAEKIIASFKVIPISELKRIVGKTKDKEQMTWENIESDLTEEDEKTIASYVSYFESRDIENPLSLIDAVKEDASPKAIHHTRLLYEAARTYLENKNQKNR